MGVSKKYRVLSNGVPKKFHVCFMSFSRKFQRNEDCFKSFPYTSRIVQSTIKIASRKFQWNLMSFEECFLGYLRMFQGSMGRCQKHPEGGGVPQSCGQRP